MRGKLVKTIRATARTLFPNRPYVEHEDKPALVSLTNRVKWTESGPIDYKPTMRVLTCNCIKKIVQDTKRHIRNGR